MCIRDRTRTKRGELSIAPRTAQLLSKAVRPLPEKDVYKRQGTFVCVENALKDPATPVLIAENNNVYLTRGKIEMCIRDRAHVEAVLARPLVDAAALDELSRREGVDALRAGPDGWLETSVEGPVTVLVVRD